MTNKEALEIGLVLAELESQLKARETPATPEEAGEMLREIMARKAAAEKPLAGESVTEPALPKSLTIFSPPFGPKDYGTVRLGLQLAELDRQVREKALRERHATERLERIEKLERMFPGAKRLPSGALVTANGKTTLEFPPGALEAAIKKRRAEEDEIARLTNPKGVPVIFPGYD